MVFRGDLRAVHIKRAFPLLRIGFRCKFVYFTNHIAISSIWFGHEGSGWVSIPVSNYANPGGLSKAGKIFWTNVPLGHFKVLKFHPGPEGHSPAVPCLSSSMAIIKHPAGRQRWIEPGTLSGAQQNGLRIEYQKFIFPGMEADSPRQLFTFFEQIIDHYPVQNGYSPLFGLAG